MYYVDLNNGLKVPQIGLGTFNMSQDILINAVLCAENNQYTMFDTSPNYFNDISLGNAIRDGNLKREDVILINKVDNSEQKKGLVRTAFEEILERMRIEYLDLYLIHWPFPGKFIDTWKVMESLYNEKLVKGIGVCNFNVHHLEALLCKANEIPIVNQIEIHPLFQQKQITEFCSIHDIKIMSYTPFARMHPHLLGNSILRQTAEHYGKTIPQIILRWNIQNGFIVIPKAQNEQHIKANIDVFDFELTSDEMASLNQLDEGFRVRFDPDDRTQYD